jgi:pyrimidine-specific ribonucleoside hydrolase
MKRKNLKIGAIILGVPVILIILVWPAAPLWQKLGVKPVCLSGKLPNLKISDCPQAATVTPMALPTPGGSTPIPIIVDDDGSPDGVIALLYFLSYPLFEVRAVTVSCGEAHPDLFASHLARLLAGLGRADIPVGAGRDTPLEGNNAFPDPWRQNSDTFWGISLPEVNDAQEPVAAAELVVETINSSVQPVVVFVSGNHTNLAEALRLDPGIVKNIRTVTIMGGSLYAPGNIKSDWPAIDNSVAEWNIWVDPVAAQEVFSSGLTIQVTPLDATNKVAWTRTDAQNWGASGTPEGVKAAEILQWMLDNWSPSGVYIWDLMAALHATDARLCPETALSVGILTAPGADQGQMLVTEGKPNAVICLAPNAEQMRAIAAETLGH